MNNPEVSRLEDALLRFAPLRQWKIVPVVFPVIPNQDIEIFHGLKGVPEKIAYQVIQSGVPCLVWHSRIPGTLPWPTGVARLRCTSPSAQVLILFGVVPDKAVVVLPTTASTPSFSIPGSYYEQGRTIGMGVWSSYTPTWASTGTQPVLNNGTLTGRFSRVGGTVWFKLNFTAGSTTTFGTGLFLFSLPSAVGFAGEVGIFSVRFYDASTATRYPAIGSMASGTQFAVNTAFDADATTPFTWATGDLIQVSGFYEGA